MSQYVTVDSQMTDQVIFDLATSMRTTSSSQITMLQAPLKGFARSADGQSYDVVDVVGVAELGKALQEDTMAAYAAAIPPEVTSAGSIYTAAPAQLTTRTRLTAGLSSSASTCTPVRPRRTSSPPRPSRS